MTVFFPFISFLKRKKNGRNEFDVCVNKFEFTHSFLTVLMTSFDFNIHS